MTSSFTDLGILDEIVKAMDEMGWKEPTPVQIDAVPVGLTGCDMFAQAQTGTGKTGTYGSIILGRTKSGMKIPSVLVLVPTRELANQVSEEITALSKYTGHRCVPIYGGVSIDNQIRKLTRGTDIVIGTPGRVKDLINRRELDFSGVSIVVLDEADRMLDMGFAKDLDFILSKVPKKRQTLLFSATMSPDIKRLALRQMVNHKEILVSKDEPTLELTKQYYVLTDKDSKRQELCNILDTNNPKTIVFCHTKRRVDQLTKKLLADRYPVGAIHGGMAQNKRERVIKSFKDGEIDVMVATDVAARGLDIDNVDCAVNYDMPVDPETYVHRIGRTGRAGKDGIAVTFVTREETYQIKGLERQAGRTIEKLDISIFNDIVHEEVKPVKRILEESDEWRPAHAEKRNMSAKQKPRLEEYKSVDRPVKPSRPVFDNKVQVELNIGRNDGMEKGKLCEFMKFNAKLSSRDVGRITLNNDNSLVEVPKSLADKVISDLEGCSCNGKQISASISDKTGR